jgi:hypothetical protein
MEQFGFTGRWGTIWQMPQGRGPITSTENFWGVEFVAGFGSSGNGPGWMHTAYYDAATRSLVGSWTESIFHRNTDERGQHTWDVYDDQDFLGRTGMYRIKLSEDHKTFVGAYNYRNQPDLWYGWAGKREGTVEFNPLEMPNLEEAFNGPWTGGDPLSGLVRYRA